MINPPHDGQFTHARHAQFARRVILPHCATLAFSDNQNHYSRIPPLMQRDVSRSSRHVGRGGSGREGVVRRAAILTYGEVVWSWHAHASAQVLAKLKGFARATVATRGSPGRVRISRNTTAQGRPVVTACTLWFSRSLRNFLRGSPGCSGHPAFPAPSAF